MKITGSPEANAIIEKSPNPDDMIRLVNDVVSSLPGVTEVSLQKIIPGRSGADVFLANTFSYGSTDIPIIIKVGPLDLLSKECINYDTFVERKLRTAPKMLSSRPSNNTDMAIAYELAGWTKSMDRLVTFGDHFLAEKYPELLVPVLIPILQDLKSFWGAVTIKQESVISLYQIYSYDDLKDSLRLIAEDEKFSSFLTNNPMSLIDILDELQFKWPFKTTLTALVHGDLNSTNILEDLDHNRSVLIDFASVKNNGHILTDISKIEREIRCRLLGQASKNFQQHLKEMEHLEDFFATISGVPSLLNNSDGFEKWSKTESYERGLSSLMNIYNHLRYYFIKFYDNELQMLSEFYYAVFFHTMLVAMFPIEEYPGQKVAAINSCFRMHERIKKIFNW